MQAGQVLDRLLRKICPDMHKLRRTALFVNVMAALHGAVLTSRIWGAPSAVMRKRSIVSSALTACCPIAACSGSAWRSIRHSPDSSSASNARCSWSIGPIWTNANAFPIAGLGPGGGSALTVYEEVHTLRTKQKPKTH